MTLAHRSSTRWDLRCPCRRGPSTYAGTSSTGATSPTAWPPHVNDRVGIRGTRLLGTVVQIGGEGEAQRFTLHVFAPADPDPGAAYELAQAAKAIRTTYALIELDPFPAFD